VHVGGLIGPMPETMRAALAERFVALDVPAGAAGDFATDTGDAIASGCEAAAIGLVERSLRQARRRLGRAPTLLVGGGGASLLADIEHAPVHVLPALVLDGLAHYARLQDD
jgi:type III pantothenate kinase